ncbi:helix-turn-helix transcriptional regulator [Lacticaseibacillus zeae]|uniref:helix-turn-helix transcriptional regulator n=1 Tax=Lacticaseibacillus zeae TaxID=57037 RepID=UPI001CDA7C70|nr:PAS domain-containing protein [Lacticaseibacillus zeae]
MTPDSYRPFLKFLAHVLGPTTEIVMHAINPATDGYDSSIVFLANSISGRTMDSPATDFIAKVLHDKLYQQQDYVVHYQSTLMNGKKVNSASFFIKNPAGELIGMICINTDVSRFQQLATLEKLSEELLQAFQPELAPAADLLESTPPTENLFIQPEGAIRQVVIEQTGTPNPPIADLTRKEKIAIVRRLYEQHFFELKDAVAKTADYLNMSTVSIYKYLQIIKQADKSTSYE